MNVFIGKGEIVKIGDLGIAKVLKNNEAQTQIGTPHYMAPEIWKSRSYTFAADIWSLGCLLYEMLSYKVCFALAGEHVLLHGSTSRGILLSAWQFP